MSNVQLTATTEASAAKNLRRGLTRRTWLSRLLQLGAGVAALDVAQSFISPAAEAQQIAPIPAARLRLGGNFNPIECVYMNMDPLATLDEAMRLNLDFVRVGARWVDIETRPGVMDFGGLEPILEACDRRGMPIVLAAGIKTPVWPDFHLPAWVQQSVWAPPTGLITRSERLRELGHRFLRRVIERYASDSRITVLQVENEPFDPQLLTNGWTLDEPYLRRQVAETRAADRLNRPIMLTAFVSSTQFVSSLQRLERRASGQLLLNPIFGVRPPAALIEMADIVGFDVYPAIGVSMLGQPMYLRPTGPADFTPLLLFRDEVLAAGKQVMIAECQAKPWEPNEKVHHNVVTPSFAPADMTQLAGQMAGFGFEQILLWGIEHWIWHRDHGDPGWWEVGSRLLEHRDLPEPTPPPVAR